jgi:WD40 repeat protein
MVATTLLLSATNLTRAAKPDLPPGQKDPVLRVEGLGPNSSVMAMAFSPDGKKLYAAGYDKVVRVWAYDPISKQFIRQRTTYRVMIGPGLTGAINTMALSPDGERLAVGGWGYVRGGTDFRHPGFVFPQIGTWDDQMRQDVGMIYVFKTTPRGNKAPEVSLLRAHRGQVLGTTFVYGKSDKPLLVSAAQERDDRANRYQGVVRLWDVDAGVCLARLTEGLPNHNRQLALAAWSTGDGPRQVRVAIAWDDGYLRVWDVGNPKPQAYKLGTFSNTAAYIPSANPPRLLTTSFQAPNSRSDQYHGLLQEWKASDGGQELATGQYKLFLPTRSDSGSSSFYAPVAFVPLSSQGNGKVDHAAVIHKVVTKDRPAEYLLQLVDLLPGDTFGTVVQKFPLEAPGETLPVLAAVPGGQFLAVAASKAHQIKLLSIPDLVRGRVKKQTISSGGATMQVLSFMRRGKALALKLRDVSADRAKAAELLFDFTNRTLTSDLNDWAPAGPDTDGWEVKASPGQLVVTRGGEDVGRPIRLKKTDRVTSYAVLPAMKPFNTPLVAVAYLDYVSGETVLCIYNLGTGERVRQFAGHVDAVRSLAFSADGRLLASAGDDQVVSVWALTDLTQVLRKRGTIPELYIDRGEGGVTVKKVGEGSPAAGKLAVDDVIEGLVLDGGRFQALDRPRKFYETMWQYRPGATVTLRLKNKGDVRVTVGQGVDERNPLFSLFITRPDDRGEQEWIGWSPVGYYDFSDRKAERFLLWHYNKGQADEPTTTAHIAQFREEYQRKGLLRFLVAEANLGDALRALERLRAAENRPRPNLMLWIDEVGPDPARRDGQGRFPVRSPRVTLKLTIADLPRDVPSTVAWQFENGPWQRFARHTGAEWSSPLAEQPWKRGTNRVRAVLRIEGEGQQEFSEELALNYVPPAPEIKYDGPARLVVKEPRFTLKAQVVAPGDEPVSVTVSQQHEGKEVLEPAQRASELQINKELTLRVGLNLIRIQAKNRKALPESADLETTSRTIEVILTKKDPPPLFALKVQTAADQPQQEVRAGQVVIVNVPRVRFVGEITARKNLARAQWSQDGKRARTLTGFEAGQGERFTVGEDVVLEPSLEPKEIRFAAKTATSDEAEVRVRIAYHPPVPRFHRTAPADETVLYDDADQAAVLVAGRFDGPADFRPFKVEILVNGQSAMRLEVDRKVPALREKVKLSPGDNRIQVRLSNAWRNQATTEAVVVSYLRRPRIQILVDNPPLVVKRPLVTLKARVTSPVPLKSVDAEVAGAGPRRPVKVKLEGPGEGDEAQVWRVELQDVVLDPGKNEVFVSAANREASTRKPVSVVVQYKEEKPIPPPDIEVVYPADNTKVAQPDLEFHARVKSEKPLKRVELIREGRSALRVPVKVARLKRNPQGFYEVKVPLQLVPEENVLRLEVLNAGGGQQSPPVVVNYIPQRPVRLEIQGLRLKGEAKLLRPKQGGNDNLLAFGEVAGNRVVIVGQVTWDSQSDHLLQDDLSVNCYVNGLRQLPVELEPAEGKKRMRTFEAEVSLTRGKDNRIQIELPEELKRSTDNEPECAVDCARPVRRQRVYLLPVTVDEEDEDAMMKRLFQALQADTRGQEVGRFKTPVFFEGRVYGPLTGYVERRQVTTLLNRIKEEIRDRKKRDLRSPDDAPGDVLMLYFRGQDAVDSGGEYILRTSDKKVAITRKELLKQFQQTLGAQVVFLDVAREKAPVEVVRAKTRAERWPDDSRVSVFLYAWLDPATNRTTDPWLIKALTAALRKKGKLEEVALAVKNQYEELKRQESKVEFFDYYPPELADLLLARERNRE